MKTTTRTRKAWFVRKTNGGFYAMAKNLSTSQNSETLSWNGQPMPTIDAARQYISLSWQGGLTFPDSITPSNEIVSDGPPSEFLYRCLSDIC
jgi:hypothetical protein